ncbi:MAG: ABC transporter ATP-binding protein [Parvularcula sp.]
MSKYAPRLGLALVFMIGLAAAEAAFVILTEWIFSGLSPSPERRFVVDAARVMVWGPVGVLGLGILQAVFFYLQSVTSQDVAISVLRDLQKKMFASISRFDFRQTEEDRSGQLVSRFTNDMTILREGLTRAPNGVRDIVRLIGLVGVLAYQDWVLFVAVLLIYPTVGYPVSLIGNRIRKIGRAVQAQMGDLTGLLSESFRGQRMVKTYGLEPYEKERMGAAFDERYRLLSRLIRIRSANEPLITVVGAIAIAAIIGIAAWRINAGLLSGPQLVSFLMGMALLSQPARGLGTLNAVVQEGLSALERVFEVLDRRPQIVDRPGAVDINVATPPTIRFDAVNFGYAPDRPVLHDFSLEVPSGSTVALVGASGAGKTSVFGLLPRLYEPQSGKILFNDQAIDQASIASVRHAIAYVSQEAVLFDDSVRANIQFGDLSASQEQVIAAAKAAAADEFIQGLPDGYETMVGEAGGNLSGGQRQRIALARAFLKDAPILLLDEATAALDAESERLVEEALGRLATGRTTLVIAHRLSTVRNADLICVMDHGRIIEQGRHDELIAKGGQYARLCALQLRETAPA